MDLTEASAKNTTFPPFPPSPPSGPPTSTLVDVGLNFGVMEAICSQDRTLGFYLPMHLVVDLQGHLFFSILQVYPLPPLS